MIRYLVDSNVLSELSRKKPNPKVVQWLASHDSELAISSLTLGEIIKGVHLMPPGKKRNEIEKWFARIDRWATGRTIPLGDPVMRRWGEFYAKHQREGDTLAIIDSLIASTALEHHLVLATRNTGDFPKDLPILNPWET